MTMRSLGNVMPIHVDMLSLVGYEFVGRDIQPAATLKARLHAMQCGLQSLRKVTNTDYGYDVQLWREYLIKAGDAHGYTHPWAYAGVDSAVSAALNDVNVTSALDMLTRGQSA